MIDESTTSVELAQAKLNRAISAWSNQRNAREGTQVERDLFQAQEQFRIACQRAFADSSDEPTPIRPNPDPKAPYFTGMPVAPAGWTINTTTAALPQYDVATEARIANLLAVVGYPAPIPGGDLIRKEALRKALQMLGIDNMPTP